MAPDDRRSEFASLQTFPYNKMLEMQGRENTRDAGNAGNAAGWPQKSPKNQDCSKSTIKSRY